MTFAAMSPWLLGAVALVVAVAVFLLYLLRRTPVAQIVSNVEFWSRAVRAAQPKFLASFRIPILSLLISLLVALAMVALLGDPRFGSGVRGTTVIVLDAGRTMDAVGLDGARRLDRGLLEVRRWVERTTIQGEVAVVRAGMRPEVLLPITDDASDLSRALDALTLDDGPSDLPAAVALADAILEEHGALAAGVGQILVITDRSTEPSARAPVVTLPVGTAAQTVAITSFAARRIPEAMGEYVVRAEVRAFTSERARGRLVVRDGDVTILESRFDLEPRTSVVLEAGGFSGARAELRAELRDVRIGSTQGDGLPGDDVAFAALPALEPIRVLLVGEGNRYLEAALAAHAGLAVDVIAPGALAGVASSALAGYQALVLDGASLPTGLTHRAVLLFEPRDASLVALGATLTRPAITAVLASHPAMDGLRLDAIQIARARALEPRTGDHVLVRSGGSALALARQEGASRLVAFGFAAAATDLVHGEGFPLLVHSTLRWLADRQEPTPLPRRLGTSLARVGDETLAAPDGRTLDDGGGYVPQVTEAGIWHVGEFPVAFSAAPNAGPLGAGATGGRFVTPSTLPPLSLLVAFALVALMLLEWMLLHRGRLR